MRSRVATCGKKDLLNLCGTGDLETNLGGGKKRNDENTARTWSTIEGSFLSETDGCNTRAPRIY